MKRKQKAAVDSAAGHLAVSFKPNPDVLEDLADQLGPLAEKARKQGAATAEDVWDRIGPYAEQARKQGAATAEDVWDRVEPYAKKARKQGAAVAHDALEKLTPYLDEALDRVGPAVETARDKVSDDLLPKLNDLLSEAAELPVAQEAARRGKATAAALRGELEPPKKKRRVGKVIGTIALIAAAGGVAALVVRKLLENRDAEWEAPAPSTYGGSNAPRRAETSPWAATTDAPVTATGPGTVGEATSEAADETSAPDTLTDSDTPPEATEATDTSDAFERRSYGEGSYIGTDPGEDYPIKGNERSMKYHTPDSPAYDRTISDVWFATPETAEQNGFTRAQR